MSQVDSRRDEVKARRDSDAKLQADADLREVLSAACGRRVLWRLLERGAEIYGQSFVSGDPLATAFKEGQRSVGLALMRELQRVDAAKYFEMVSEALAEARINATLEEAAETDSAEI